MIWSRLKNNRCPDCNEILRYDILADMHVCTAQNALKKKCGFKISGTRFNEIAMDLYAPKFMRRDESGEDNLSRLNNLGHEVMSEDYSDQQ